MMWQHCGEACHPHKLTSQPSLTMSMLTTLVPLCTSSLWWKPHLHVLCFLINFTGHKKDWLIIDIELLCVIIMSMNPSKLYNYSFHKTSLVAPPLTDQHPITPCYIQLQNILQCSSIPSDTAKLNITQQQMQTMASVT